MPFLREAGGVREEYVVGAHRDFLRTLEDLMKVNPLYRIPAAHGLIAMIQEK